MLTVLLLVSRIVVVDLAEHKWHAYESSRLVKSGKAIGGRPRCIDQPKSCKTPIGIFKILKKYGKNKRSIKYPLGCCKTCKKKCARMAWFQKFHHEGVGFHASDEINVNFNASHGCIRLTYEDAKWLSSWTEVGDKVVILPYRR